MTMFQKGTWTVLSLQPVEVGASVHDCFVNHMSAIPSEYIPILAIARTLQSQAASLALSPFSRPRPDAEAEVEYTIGGKSFSDPFMDFLKKYPKCYEWTYDPAAKTLTSPDETPVEVDMEIHWEAIQEFRLNGEIYAAWWMAFDYTDAQDVASKKEQMAYDHGAPFKFQNAEVKKMITDSLVDLNTFTRKHYQVVFDFQQNLAWINATTPQVVSDFILFLESAGMVCTTPKFIPEDTPEIYPILNHLFDNSLITAEVTQRLADLKLHGSEAPPHPDAGMEKLLKDFFAFTEADGFHIGMSAPGSVFLVDTLPTPTSVKTNFEAAELLLNEGSSRVNEATLTFGEYSEITSKSGETKQVYRKKFSIFATTKWGLKELPGKVFKALEIEDMKRQVKDYIKATDRSPSIAEFWLMYYRSMREAVSIYESTLIGIQER